MARWRDAKRGSDKESKKEQKENRSSNTFGLASLPSRLKAFITDSFLITTPIVYVTIYLLMGSGQEFSQHRGIGWLIILVVHFIVIMAFWLKSAQTPGLKAYEGKLVNASNKEKIGVIQATIRYFATLFSIISFFCMFLPFFRKDKKTFQDLVSNSCIIEHKD